MLRTGLKTSGEFAAQDPDGSVLVVLRGDNWKALMPVHIGIGCEQQNNLPCAAISMSETEK